MDQLNKVLFKKPEEEKTEIEKLNDACCEGCPALSYQQRLFGYFACLSLAVCLSLGSLTRFIDLLHGDPDAFVVCYTLSNILALVATVCFVSTPAKQCRKMWDKERWPASTVYLASIVGTLVVCYAGGIPGDVRVGLLLAMLSVQWAAMIYFMVSFIPFAKDYCCLLCTEGPRDCWKRCRGGG
jgi:Na+/melibiose symporter-like transporter